METLRIPERYRIFDGAALKWIAIITMFIDHSAKGVLYLGFLKPRFPVAKGSDLYTLYQLYKVLRGVGRIAFPIFCFFLIQGFLYTRSREKYMLRMLVFALVSEIPFDLALYGRIVYPTHQNVYFTLLLGLLMLYLWELIQNRVKPLFLATIFQVASWFSISSGSTRSFSASAAPSRSTGSGLMCSSLFRFCCSITERGGNRTSTCSTPSIRRISSSSIS